MPKPAEQSESLEQTLSPAEAKALILKGKAPDGLRVSGTLDLSKNPNLLDLPAGLTVDNLNLHNCSELCALPVGLQVKRLDVNGCTSLVSLPAGLDCYEIRMQRTAVKKLPSDLQVKFRLDLAGCVRLKALPEGLSVGSLILSGCVALEALPEGLDVCFLDVSGCTGLMDWPQKAAVRLGRFNAAGCTQIRELPPWLDDLTQLNVRGCINLARLPEGLRVSSWVDLADTAITSLPLSMQGVQLRWHDVRINEQIAFYPETITAQAVLDESNIELRRVMLERMGYEHFFDRAHAVVLDQDVDAGGDRWLMRVPFEDDEDLVCVSVACPSTSRRYVVRVPPTMTTCQQAVAWVAGFDDPDLYAPLIET
jgi:hypothetical protein